MTYIEKATQPREGIAKAQNLRRGSFSSEEAFFLRKLLLDDHSPKESDQWMNENDQSKVLDDEVLLSVPPRMLKDDEQVVACTSKLPSSHQKAKRRSIKGLWEAHASGVNLKSLQQRVSPAPADDTSVASSWDEEDDDKMFDTWEVR